MNINKFIAILTVLFFSQIIVFSVYGQVGADVIKAQKKAEKTRKKAEKKAMQQQLVEMLNQQYYGDQTTKEEPNKDKPEKEREKNNKTKPSKENNQPTTPSVKKEKETNPKAKYVNNNISTQTQVLGSTPSAPVFPKNILSQCKYSFNTTDEFTGKSKIGTVNQLLFTYTEEGLRKFMKEKEFLTCNGYISDIAGIKALNLEFIFDSPYAKQEYGAIQAGSSLIIRLINDETITLESQQFDPGTKNLQQAKTYYSSVYLISPKAEKELRKAEIDKVRMVWGVGYEDYEVYELDFFIDQFSCLDAANR